MVEIELIDLIVLASGRSRLRIGQHLDFVADRLEALADHQADQIEVGHHQVVYVDQIEVPDNLKHHPSEDSKVSVLFAGSLALNSV